MAELALVKTVHGLMPVAANDNECVQRLKLGEVVRGDFKRMRNGQFHRKYMALLNLAFDHFEVQPVTYRGQQVTPQKDFDEFRRWVAVMAGFYDVVGYPDGSVRVRAKSISFANMDEEEFSNLYSASINVLLQHVLHQYNDYSEVEHVVEQLVRF